MMLKQMKKLAPLAVTLGLLGACTLDSEVEQLLTTDLEITVKDSLNKPVSGASVAIFRNKRDWESLTRPVAFAKTNQDGNIRFQDLESANYYFYATFEQGGKRFSNQYLTEVTEGKLKRIIIEGDNYNLSDVLTENGLTKVSLVVDEEVEVTAPRGFNIVQVEYYFADEADSDTPPSHDTLNYVLYSIYNYDEEKTVIQNRDDNAIDVMGVKEFRDMNSNAFGRRSYWRANANINYELKGIMEGTNTLTLVNAPVIPGSVLLADSPSTYEIDKSSFNLETLPMRLKDIGTFEYGNDYYSIDLIIRWQ